MKPEKPLQLDELIQALSSRPGLPGLTPTSRSRTQDHRSTAAIVEEMLRNLREKATC